VGVKKEADNKKEQLAPARLVKRQYLAILMAIVFAALIFAFDYLMPLGVAGGVPYAAVVLVGLAVRSPLAVLLFAGPGYFADGSRIIIVAGSSGAI